MNRNASALGRMARGVKKKLSRSMREKRREQLAHARKSRWVRKDKNENHK